MLYVVIENKNFITLKCFNVLNNTAYAIQYQMKSNRMLMNILRTRKEEITAYFKALPHYLHGGTEENNHKS
jgi:hypothetical protein